LIIRFDRVSTISNRMLAHLRQKGVRQGRCVLFPNWVDPRVIFPLREERERLRHEFGFPAENTILLYSGNMGNKQGLEVLIEAAKLVRSRPEILFVLCGDGAQRQYLEQRARGLENVQFLAVQPLDRLNALLNTADIHLLPQRAGAEDLVLPSKLAGMLASGVPVILMANQGTELAAIGQQVGVVVPPEDAAALVGAIFELQEDAPRRRRLGQAGLNWAKMYWFKEQVLSEFVRQLEALMVGSHPGE
jgi:colanic acid biosynthesis glycosyl transferase WcaI